LISWLWGSLTSLRLTISLLLVLAALAIAGTLRYSQIYYTPWFLVPVALLALNLLACLVEGLPRALRRVSQPFTREAAMGLPERGQLSWPPGINPGPQVEAALRRELGRPRKLVSPDRTVYLCERGRLRPLGPYLVHVSLLLILAGALLGKYWGVEGTLVLLKGETASSFEGKTPGAVRPLDFQVRLDNFQVRYYQDGKTPQEFRSDLTFQLPGEKPFKAVCRVNEPVTFGGFTFYQASYGRPVRLQVTNGAGIQVLEAPLGRPLPVPGSQARVKVLDFEENLVMPMGAKSQALGPGARLAYKEDSGRAHLIWVLKNYPQLADRQPGPDRFILLDASPHYFSVLQVKHDPGVWWVYGGFLLLLPGLYLALLRPRQRWAVVLQPLAQGGWEGRLLAASPRSREDFVARQERLLKRLQAGGPSC
jgi:cytochrome c biogenesis protein